MPSSEVMHKWKHNQLHSGSKKGPLVKNRAQAIAIMLSEKRAEAANGGKYPERAYGGPLMASLGIAPDMGGMLPTLPTQAAAPAFNATPTMPAPGMPTGGTPTGVVPGQGMYGRQANMGASPMPAALLAQASPQAMAGLNQLSGRGLAAGTMAGGGRVANSFPGHEYDNLSSTEIENLPPEEKAAAYRKRASDFQLQEAGLMPPINYQNHWDKNNFDRIKSVGVAFPNTDWDKFSQQARPSTNIEDHRTEDTVYPEETTQLRAAGGIAGGVGGFDMAKQAHTSPSYATKGEMRSMMRGPIMSAVPGRTDAHKGMVPSGSYVIPADVVSGRGQGNTAAGMVSLQKLFRMGPYGSGGGPYGSSTGALKVGHSMPKAMQAPKMKLPGMAAAGGAQDDHVGVPVDVNLAGGEMIVPPENLMQVVHPDLDTAHSIMDKWVIHERKKHIKTLSDLPGPVRD